MHASLGRVVAKATITTVLSIAASLLLAVTIVPALGGIVDGNAWLMIVLCPLLIAWPASAYQFWQHERLKRAHQEIGRLHHALGRAHEELRARNQELAVRARHDGMTGLLNREGFFAEVSRALARGRDGALLVIDADHFKDINDRHGHPTGDAALIAIASAIRLALPEGDFCGRIGGEEFAAYLHGVTAAEANAIAEALRQAVAACSVPTPSGQSVSLAVSIGGRLSHPGQTLEQLVIEADRQLYEAKRRGRDQVVVDEITRAA
jgi:diguanylate cyclase (GGDEF)-like protein